jgi:cyclase
MLEELAPGIYAYVQADGSWFINNTGMIADAGSVVCVDSCATEARTLSFLTAIRSVTSRPVEILVNTHHHPDHTNGNGLLGAHTIVAHTACRAELVRAPWPPPAGVFEPVLWGKIDARPPSFCFEDSAHLFVTGRRLELLHLGPAAHTTNDVVVWLPDERILFAGDLVWGAGTPFALSGSITGWLGALERLEALAPALVVPGHGPVGGPELLVSTADYLRFVWRVARAGHHAGLSPLQTARATDLDPYAELAEPERIVGNLARAFAELDGLPPGGPVDHPAAFEAMVEFNRGRPLRCVA